METDKGNNMKNIENRENREIMHRLQNQFKIHPILLQNKKKCPYLMFLSQNSNLH